MRFDLAIILAPEVCLVVVRVVHTLAFVFLLFITFCVLRFLLVTKSQEPTNVVAFVRLKEGPHSSTAQIRSTKLTSFVLVCEMVRLATTALVNSGIGQDKPFATIVSLLCHHQTCVFFRLSLLFSSLLSQFSFLSFMSCCFVICACSYCCCSLCFCSRSWRLFFLSSSFCSFVGFFRSFPCRRCSRRCCLSSRFCSFVS